jgi:hypothetical protein
LGSARKTALPAADQDAGILGSAMGWSMPAAKDLRRECCDISAFVNVQKDLTDVPNYADSDLLCNEHRIEVSTYHKLSFVLNLKPVSLMEQHIIISCIHEDKRYLNKIQKWALQGRLPGQVYVIPQDDEFFYHEDGSLHEERIVWAIKEASLVVVLVGENNLDHPWLFWEGEFCHQWGIKRVLLRIPYTTGELPAEFKVLREIAFNPNAIEKELKEFANPNQF